MGITVPYSQLQEKGYEKDIAKMRLGVLREIKEIKRFFDIMEKGVKSRDEVKVQRAYVFMKSLVYQMDEGELTPLSIEVHQALLSLEDD